MSKCKEEHNEKIIGCPFRCTWHFPELSGNCPIVLCENGISENEKGLTLKCSNCDYLKDYAEGEDT